MESNPAPVGLPLRQLNTPEAKELAELALYQADVAASIAALILWHKKYYAEKLDDDEEIISQTLMRDAILLFVSCFDPTAKYRLDPDVVYEAAEGGDVYFTWLKDIRDSYIAHKFGAHRQSVAGVIADQSFKVIGVGFFILTPKRLISQEQCAQLVGFMQIAADYIKAKIDVLRTTIRQAADKMSPDEIKALKLATTYAIDSGEARLSRNELQKSRKNKPPHSTNTE